MLALPPPPPPPPSTKSISQNQILLSKQLSQSHEPYLPNSTTAKSTRPLTLSQPQIQRTNPIIWFVSILCLIFSLLLIIFGVSTLIIFLSIKPRNPTFDIPNANLNALYFDSQEYFNGDFILLANFTNPNRKIDVKFESLDVDLFFFDRIISTQSIQPFTMRRKESRLESLHFISSLVFLPKDLGVKLKNQVEGNKVNYNIRGTFRVRVSLGFFHLSYILHSRCQLEMTGPPTGILVARNCITKR